MAKLYNLARMTTATTGTGTITLGSAVASYVTFADAGAQNGQTITYAIVDGNNREVGRGVYTASGTTLTRSVLESTNSNNPINLSGSAEVFITAAAEDIANVNETNTFSANQIISVTDNSNAALRITQLGTGESLRVEDSTNPDSTPFVIDSNGSMTTSSTVNLTGSSQTNAGASSLLNMAQTWNAPTIAVTSVSGNGTSVTLTHAAQASAIPVGSTINVAGFTPSGYNTSAGAVTASTTTTTTYTNATTAAVTILGTVQVNIVSPIFLNITNTASAGTPFLMDLRSNGTNVFGVTRTGAINTAAGLSVQNTASVSWFNRGILTSPAAGGVQLGSTDAAAPVAQTFSAQSVSTGTSNTAGQDLTIRGSRGTGTGAGGNIIFQTAPAGASGTSQNAAVERFRIDTSGALGIGGANYGTSGQVLTSGGSGVAPSWASANSITLLGTITTTSGTTQSLTGLNLTGYSFLLLFVNGVSASLGTDDLSLIDGASNTFILFTDSNNSTNVFNGTVWVNLNNGSLIAAGSSNGTTTYSLSSATNVGGTAGAKLALGRINQTTASTSIGFSVQTGFDAGTVTVYGVR